MHHVISHGIYCCLKIMKKGGAFRCRLPLPRSQLSLKAFDLKERENKKEKWQKLQKLSREREREREGRPLTLAPTAPTTTTTAPMAVGESSDAGAGDGDGGGRVRSGGQSPGEVTGEREIRDLEELLSKLNPMAKEFVPPSLANHHHGYANGDGVFPLPQNGGLNGHGGQRRRSGYGPGRRRVNSRTSLAQREDVIRRTVYVSDIDHQVTEERLALLFINCGQVIDCRICGDPNSVLRFAFIEFTDEEGARAALGLSGTVLGYYPVRVLPSKTAIAPVNPTFLPKSDDEREICTKTIYCTNIDKKVTQAELKLFFESICGEVYRFRLLGDQHHSTRIAFVEFVMPESATAALNCCGVVLRSLPIRVSPSKTPIRPRASRPPMH